MFNFECLAWVGYGVNLPALLHRVGRFKQAKYIQSECAGGQGLTPGYVLNYGILVIYYYYYYYRGKKGFQSACMVQSDWREEVHGCTGGEGITTVTNPNWNIGRSPILSRKHNKKDRKKPEINLKEIREKDPLVWVDAYLSHLSEQWPRPAAQETFPALLLPLMFRDYCTSSRHLVTD